jgi:hypothetical protein
LLAIYIIKCTAAASNPLSLALRPGARTGVLLHNVVHPFCCRHKSQVRENTCAAGNYFFINLMAFERRKNGDPVEAAAYIILALPALLSKWMARSYTCTNTHPSTYIHTPYILTHDRSARTVRICIIYTERAYTTQYISRARACKEFAVANSREMTRHPIHACVLRLERLWGLRASERLACDFVAPGE